MTTQQTQTNRRTYWIIQNGEHYLTEDGWSTSAIPPVIRLATFRDARGLITILTKWVKDASMSLVPIAQQFDEPPAQSPEVESYDWARACAMMISGRRVMQAANGGIWRWRDGEFQIYIARENQWSVHKDAPIFAMAPFIDLGGYGVDRCGMCQQTTNGHGWACRDCIERLRTQIAAVQS